MEVKGIVLLFTGGDQEKEKKKKRKLAYNALILAEGALLSENKLEYVETINILHCT